MSTHYSKYSTPQCNTYTNFYVGIKSERRDFKEARAPSEFWSYWSAKLKSIFFSFYSRFNNDPVKKMEEAIPATNTDFKSFFQLFKKE